jgi:hypothetical protein
VVLVACGRKHKAVVLDDRSLFTFGYGGSGLLGHGDTQHCFAPTRVALPCAAEREPPAVVGIAFSATHAGGPVPHAAVWTSSIFAWGKADAPRLMGPVQGRFVSDVFAAHGATVWVACGSREEAAPGFDASTDSRIIIQLWQNSGNVAPIILHYVLQ